MTEPDYDWIQQCRDEERADRNLARLDRIYGRVEDYRRPRVDLRKKAS
jgi:hypothetical protein